MKFFVVLLILAASFALVTKGLEARWDGRKFCTNVGCKVGLGEEFCTNECIPHGRSYGLEARWVGRKLCMNVGCKVGLGEEFCTNECIPHGRSYGRCVQLPRQTADEGYCCC
ncbi:hypothetical protein L1987_23658 [Smallanthus sonchifolius]|uniref:Uncharacterized protein n=1 Tax=Smallanthus sonchifolius TaxID=185202 RepID=A0ACB9IIH6_9ASTR|nr:hypothetical protein L1987_23658 [Smallanthus sonchifolius]